MSSPVPTVGAIVQEIRESERETLEGRASSLSREHWSGWTRAQAFDFLRSVHGLGNDATIEAVLEAVVLEHCYVLSAAEDMNMERKALQHERPRHRPRIPLYERT